MSIRSLSNSVPSGLCPFSVCLWLDVGLSLRCPLGAWCYLGEIEALSTTLDQEGLAGCGRACDHEGGSSPEILHHGWKLNLDHREERQGDIFILPLRYHDMYFEAEFIANVIAGSLMNMVYCYAKIHFPICHLWNQPGTTWCRLFSARAGSFDNPAKVRQLSGSLRVFVAMMFV